MSGQRKTSPGTLPGSLSPNRGMASKPGGSGASNAPASGPVVTRRIGAGSNTPATSSPLLPSATGPAGRVSAGSSSNGSKPDRLKPSIRQTIESMVSTGSQSEYFKPEQTIILFDWDDTLCPSNWIRENRPALSFFKPCPADEKYQRPLRELQKHVEAVLKLALKLGRVIIVTNAMEPWVETSCRNFLPLLMPYVLDIPVIYARSIFDAHNLENPRRQVPGSAARASSGTRALPGLYTASGQNKLGNYSAQLQNQARQQQQVDEMAPQRWKELAFQIEIGGFYSRYEHQSWKNVISIGDSIFERDAVRKVVVQRPSAKKKCRTKTAKLLDEPEIEELIAQVKVIHDALGLMVQYDGNLDIEIDEEDLKVDLSLAEKIMDR